MPWSQHEDLWTHDVYPYEIQRTTSESLQESFVLRIDGEYFVRATLRAAQEYAQERWNDWNAGRTPWTRRGAAWTHKTCLYQIKLGSEGMPNGSIRDSFTVRTDSEYFVGSTLEQAQDYAELQWQRRNARR